MKPFFQISIITLLFFGLETNVFAQQNQKKAQQIESIKFGYISGKLDLTNNESEEFWPLYRNYQSEWNNLLKQKKQNRIANANNPDRAVDDDFLLDEKILALKKRYRVEFGKVLSAEKLKKLYQAERSFREELIKQLRNRPQGN